MDKVKEIEAAFNHGISLAERKNVVITGVKKIDSFDNEEFLMDTTLGFLAIKGKIDSLIYVENGVSKNKEESFLGKLFK